MEHTKIEVQVAQQPPEEQEARRPWVTPDFKCFPLNEALSGTAGWWDGSGFGS
jgi:hypothetical protein